VLMAREHGCHYGHPCPRAVLTGRELGQCVFQVPVSTGPVSTKHCRQHVPCSRVVKRFLRAPVNTRSRLLGTHYPCSRAVIAGSVDGSREHGPGTRIVCTQPQRRNSFTAVDDQHRERKPAAARRGGQRDRFVNCLLFSATRSPYIE